MQVFQNICSKIFSLILIILLFLIIYLQHGDISSFFLPKAKDPEVTLDHIKQIFPNAASFQLATAPDVWGKVLDPSGKEIGQIIVTFPYANAIEGFGGPVPFIVGATQEGKILGLALLMNAESESFLEELSQKKFFDQWNGLNVTEALQKKVDAVSGATMTSSAVIGGIQNRMASLSGERPPAASIQPARLAKNILAGLVLIWASWSFFFPQMGNRYRTWLLIANIVVLGFLNGYFISMALTYRWLLNGIPWAGLPILAVLVFWILAIHIGTNKPLYCAFVCPYGSAQELMGKILSKKPCMPGWIVKLGKHSRKVVLGGLVFLLILGCNFDLTYAEPFSAFLYDYAAWSVIILASVFLFVSLFYPRFWCRYLCPSGQLLDLFCKGTKQAEQKPEESDMTFHKTMILLLIAVIIILLLKPHLPVFTSGTAGNDALSVIHSRKSVRKYLDKPVSKEVLYTLLKAGMAAPSAADKRPWAFLTITEKTKLVALSEGLQTGKMLKEAGAAIVVCGVTSKMLPGPEKRFPEISREFWVQDCSAVTQNILLAAEASQLGAVWIGIYPLEDRVTFIRECLKLPADIIPLCVVSIGYPTGIEKPKIKYDEAAIHWNEW